jgi:hypothetical protein
MKKLAANNILNALIFPVLLVPTLTFLAWVTDGFWISSNLILGALYCGLSAWIYFSAKGTFNLFYDSEFLYLNGLVKNIKIPLAMVQKIQRSHDGIKVQGVNSWKYTIVFKGNENITVQSLYEVDGSTTVEEFAAAVKQINSHVIFLK